MGRCRRRRAERALEAALNRTAARAAADDRAVLEEIAELREARNEWDGVGLLDGVRARVQMHLARPFDIGALEDFRRAQEGEDVG